MKYFRNEIEDNETNEDKNTNNEISKDYKIFVNHPFKTKFKQPLYNPSTFVKDVEILDAYAQPFYNFFIRGATNSLPMFTYPPEPKSVKRVTVDKTFTLQANQTGYIQIFPFSRNIMFTQNGTQYQNLLTNDQLNCFINYKVVCCKIMVKQIGIMHLSDGYGTAFDAVMTTSSSSFEYLKENLLGVQTSPGRKVMMIDGRTGIEAFFLGSPLYEYNYNYQAMFMPKMFVRSESSEAPDGDPVYIPANSIICPTHIDSNSVVYYDDNTTFRPDFGTTLIYKKIVKIKGIGLLVQPPQGDSIFIRISPPTINVSIKLYIDLVVEGQVKDEFLSNMPQYIPPTPFDFNRIQFAFANVVPSIRVIEQLSNCLTSSEEKKLVYPLHPSLKNSLQRKSYKGNIFMRIDKSLDFEIPSEKVKRIRKKKAQKIRRRRIIRANYLNNLNRVHIGFFPLISTTDELHEKEIDTKRWICFNLGESFNLSFEDTYRSDSLDTKRLVESKERNNMLVSYCSQNLQPKNIKRLTTIKKFSNIVNQVELPMYLQEACLFTGEVVTMLKSTSNSNRMYRDSFTPLPNVSYQYFPAITNQKEAYPALLAVKLGIFGDSKTTYKVPLAESGQDAELTVSYFKEQFTSEDEFLGVLDTIISYAYGKLYHYCPSEGFTIKLFGKGKFEDKSYMLALTAAIFGVPSGGFYTGSFEEKKGVFIPVKMEQEVIEAKLKIATPDFPLTVLGAELNDGTTINTISGGIPSYSDGKMMPSNDVSTTIIYTMTPFSIRGYRKTPLSEKNADAKRFLTDQMASDIIKYIVFSNVSSIQQYENLSKEIPYKYYSRANPDNFTCYVLKNSRIIEAGDFYEKYPDLLDEGPKPWSFEYKNTLFIERNAFLSDIRKMKYKGTIKGDRSNILKYENINKSIKNINSNDVEKIKEEIWEELSKEGSKIKGKIEMEEISKDNLTREVNEKDLKMFSPYKDLIIDGLAALFNLIDDNPPSSRSSKTVTENPSYRSLLGALGIPLNVKGTVEVQGSNEWKYFKAMVEELGAGGLTCAANIFGWVENPQKRYKTSTLQKLLDGLKRLDKKKLPKLPEEDNEKTEEIRSKTEKRYKQITKQAPKQSNKGDERSEVIEDEEEPKEEKDESRRKRVKKNVEEVYDYFEQKED